MNEEPLNFTVLSALEGPTKPTGLSLEDVGGKDGARLPARAFAGPDPVGLRISDHRPCG
jgi:hypothetical protein